MRKLIAALLMATTLAPVAAAAQEADIGTDTGISRRGEQRRMQQDRVRPAPAMDRIAPGGDRGTYRNRDTAGSARQDGDRPALDPGQSRIDAQRIDRRPDRGTRDGSFGMDQRFPHRADRRADNDGRRTGQDRIDDRRDRIQRSGDRRGYDQRRSGGYGASYADRAYDRQGFDDRRNWNRGWRAENRYDWARYRGVNRSAYRLPRYYSPYGWNGYRRFPIGVSLSSALWGRNYWIDDPWSYRLPDAYGAYRWVRYYDDALLVDLDSGEVVDAVYGIFW